ncbi:hypothetical protein HYW18_01430 [Candidatus Uhrbacteria bacterium]|nr:hypothetical protein [Candidatus Uhrbacteria bacterium]
MKFSFFFLVLLLALAGGAWGLAKVRNLEPAPVVVVEEPAEDIEEPPAEAPMRVLSPKEHTLVKSPLSVMGEARGFWFFEASFPVRIEDGEGNMLGEGIATAQTDWMTEEFVPFFVTIEFDPGEATVGALVLMRDNPSGLPENDAEVRVPVFFILP